MGSVLNAEMVLLYRSRIGNTPIRRLLSRGNTSPLHNFGQLFSVAFRWANSTPDWSPQTHPCFPLRGVGHTGAAPNTHQDQGSVTSRPQARHRLLAPVVPQKTVSALPRPIVYGTHMLWLPCRSRFPMAHGRGVARRTNPVGGHLVWVEVRTNHTHGSQPFFLPVSHLNPTPGSTSATSFVDIKGDKVSHDVIARPRQCMGHRLPSHHQMAFGVFP